MEQPAPYVGPPIDELHYADGDCILWPTQDASENEDSADSIGRWKLTDDEVNALIETGEVDEVE